MTSIVTITTARTDSGSLVSLDALKAELAITTTETDDYLTALLVRLSGLVESYCQRVFAVESVSETFRSVYGDRLMLARYPVTEVASVTEDGTALTTDLYEVETGSGMVFRLESDRRRCWSAEKVVVAYSTGFATLPPVVEQQIYKLAKMEQAARTRDPALRSENILEGLYSYTLFAPSELKNGLPPEVAASLDPYRVLSLG